MRVSVLAIDPAPEFCAWAHLVDGVPASFGRDPTPEVLARLRGEWLRGSTLVVERIACYGMPVGESVFRTCYVIGRILEVRSAVLLPRLACKLAMCHSPKANDAAVRQAILDRFGGSGSLRKGGVLYKAAKDVWAALAVGLAYTDGVRPAGDSYLPGVIDAGSEF